MKWIDGEREIRLLRSLCTRDRIAIDVGANIGVYTWHLRRLAKRVVAYEANPALAARLRDAFAGDMRVDVRACAVSERAGRVTLQVPVYAGKANDALGSVAGKFPGSPELRTHEVESRRLDDEAHLDVGFLKIDVEGHEKAVLEGARELISRERPTILVEIEERHAPGALRDVPAMLDALGYDAFFLRDTALVPFARFDAATMQNPAVVDERGAHGLYLNNFLFLPRDPSWSGQRDVLRR